MTTYLVNSKKLIGKIHEEGFNFSSFSKEMGISRNTLARCLKRPNQFKIDYLNRIVTTLNLSREEQRVMFIKRYMQ